MGSFFAYSIQSAVCLALFYLFYKVLLSRETFHRFNRFGLLGILVLSMLIPCMLTVFPLHTTADTVIPETQLFADYTSKSAKISVDETENRQGHVFLSFLLIAYLTGCIVSLLHVTHSTIRIRSIIRKGSCSTNDNGTKLVLVDDTTVTSFSWMKYIVLSRTDYKMAGESIMAHEKAHIRLRHSYDLIIAQLCIITQWFNPAAWLLYRELQNIHEYEADEAVISAGIDAKQYQLLLIKKAVGTRLYSMANSFNHSNLKKRITMMLQRKSNPYARLKYAYVLPLAVVAVALFAQPEVSLPFEEISNAKVSHFTLETSKNEVKNLPEADFTATIATPAATIQLAGVDEILATDEKDPEFPGGYAALLKWFNEAKESKTNVQPNPTTSAKNVEPQQGNTEDEIFKVVDKEPEFPGGYAALMKWFNDKAVYPTIAFENGIQGRVSCQFVVNKDGSVQDIVILATPDPSLAKEAERVLKIIPKFKPGEVKGKPVRCYFNVAFHFQLSQKNNASETKEQTKPTPSIENEKKQQGDSEDKIFTVVEKDPEFPGGTAALMKWFNDNAIYPAIAEENGIQGRVSCQFVVNKDGSVQDIAILSAPDPSLAKEAERVLKKIPKFKPGENGGKPVRTQFKASFTFRLPPS